MDALFNPTLEQRHAAFYVTDHPITVESKCLDDKEMEDISQHGYDDDGGFGEDDHERVSRSQRDYELWSTQLRLLTNEMIKRCCRSELVCAFCDQSAIYVCSSCNGNTIAMI